MIGPLGAFVIVVAGALSVGWVTNRADDAHGPAVAFLAYLLAYTGATFALVGYCLWMAA